MHTSGRFAVAVHALALAIVAEAEEAGGPITSETMASIVGVHPVHVRRVLGGLREAGLVTSQSGPGGGWSLTAAPGTITLRDIYRAVEPVASPLDTQPHAAECCPFGPGLPLALDACFQAAQAAFDRTLEMVTLTDVMNAARNPGNTRCPAADAIREPSAAD